MDFENIEKLGQIATLPISHSRSSWFGSTFSVNTFGDLLIIGEDGHVYYRNIREANRGPVEISSTEDADVDGMNSSFLQIQGITAEELRANYHHIESNSEGTVLVLWSKTHVGIVEIPVFFIKDGLLAPPSSSPSTGALGSAGSDYVSEDEVCRFISLIAPSPSTAQTRNSIVKLHFHPLNPNSLIVLRERDLLTVIDLRNYEKEEIVLPKNLSFSSFCFGNSTTEWFRFTIFLTTVTNEIYYLCPIIPAGTILSKGIIAELLGWIIEHEEEIENRLLQTGRRPSSSTNTNTSTNATRNGPEKDLLDELRQFFQYSLQYLKLKFSKIIIEEMIDHLHENPAYYEHLNDQNQNISSAAAPFNFIDSYLTAENGTTIALSDFYDSFPERLPAFEREPYSKDENESIDFSNVRIALQGPLTITRSNKQQELLKKEKTSLSIHDICIPTVPSNYSGMIAPLLVTVQSNGNVEVLLFDIVDENLWLLGPAWKPLLSTSVLQYLPVPNLVVADDFQVKSVSSESYHPTGGPADSFQLLPDPVFSHYLYCVNKRQGEVYLLISNWLQEAVASITKLMDEFNQQGNNRGGDENNDLGDAEEKKMNDEPSYQRSSMTENAVQGPSSSSSAHPVSECFPLFQNENAVEDHRGINGLKVLKDPFLGHLLLIHTDAQEFMVVNITTHLKVCQLQSTLQEDLPSKEMNLIQQQLSFYTSNEHLRYRKSQQFILQIAEGLQTLPKLEIFLTKENKEIPKSEAQNKKELIETAQLLEKRVITPLRGLLQNLFFHMELIEQMYQIQFEVLTGKETTALPTASSTIQQKEEKEQQQQQLLLGGNFTSLTSTQQKDLLLTLGVKGILTILSKENELLRHRIQSIQEKNQQLKEEIDRYLLILLNARKQLTKGEKLYKQQLEEWLTMVPKLSRDIEILKQTFLKYKLVFTQATTTSSSSSTSVGGNQKKEEKTGTADNSAAASVGGGGGNVPKAGFHHPSTGKIGFPFQQQQQFHQKPFFTRTIQPLPALGSPSAQLPASNTNNSAVDIPASAAPPAVNLEAKSQTIGSFGSPTLSFNTTIGSNHLFLGNKSFAKTPFGTITKPAANQSTLLESPSISASSSLLLSPNLRTNKEGKETGLPIPSLSSTPTKPPAVGGGGEEISDLMKNTMTLNELSSANKPSQSTALPSSSSTVQIELTSKDQELCFELLKSQEELIQQNKVKVASLERKLQTLKRLQQQQQQER